MVVRVVRNNDPSKQQSKYLPTDRYLVGLECTTFYCLEALMVALKKDDEIHRHSWARLLKEVREAKEKHTHLLALALRDYLALASFGEARHSRKGGKKSFIQGFPRGSRSDACTKAMRYDPNDFLPKIYDVFEGGGWSSAYGGPKWGQIALSALRHYTGEWSDLVLCDYAFNLTHNGGLCYDKGFLWTCQGKSSVLAFLTLKAEKNIQHWGQLVVPRLIYDFLKRAYHLKAIRLLSPVYKAVTGSHKVLLVDGYTPIVWGARKVGPVIKGTNHPDYDPDEEYDYDEDSHDITDPDSVDYDPDYEPPEPKPLEYDQTASSMAIFDEQQR